MLKFNLIRELYSEDITGSGQERIKHQLAGFYANLLAERGHDVVIACDTYGKLGVLAEGNKLNDHIKLVNLNAKTTSWVKTYIGK